MPHQKPRNHIIPSLVVRCSAALVAALVLPSCFAVAKRMNQPSPEQQAQADASRSQHCVTATQALWDTFCDHPPKKVIEVYVQNAKTSRNSLAPSCKNNPEQLQRLDTCIADLEARAE